jgi:hypothetical protein
MRRLAGPTRVDPVVARDDAGRHGCPPWSNFRNYVILADIHRTRRGIDMRLGVFYFPTDYGINIAEKRVK